MIETKLKFDEKFFDEEIRSDFYVTRKRKEIWAIQLDMLFELDCVCKKYGIKYYLDGGTLLGAIRHKGYIPWDDDIDVVMFRKDYNKFLKIGPNEFRHPYFFQHAYNEAHCRYRQAKIRNNLTCGAMKKEFLNVKTHQGIFIDIFCLDKVTKNEENYKAQIKELKLYENMIDQMSLNNVPTPLTIRNKDRKAIKIYENILQVYSAFQKCAARYENEATDTVTLLEYWIYDEKLLKNEYKIEWFGEPQYVEFENLMLPVPINSDAILKVHYGENYMKPIQGASDHGDLIVDTNRSYLEVLKELML